MDAHKTSPGICGCGRRDEDPDLDGIPSCNDGCPFDIDKTNPGICGCGLFDNDSDGDLMSDCHDRCPSDPLKITPGVCGCGESEEDTNSDGLPDCLNGFRFDSTSGDPDGRSRGLGGICGSIGMMSFGMTVLGFGAIWFAQRPRWTRRRHSAKANESP